jgi:hypothetical protein
LQILKKKYLACFHGYCTFSAKSWVNSLALPY